MTSRQMRVCFSVLLSVFFSACASNPKSVQLPISVQSNPLGAYVLLQVHNPEVRNKDDWIFV